MDEALIIAVLVIIVWAIGIFAFSIRSIIKYQKSDNTDKKAKTQKKKSVETKFTTRTLRAKVVDLSFRTKMVSSKTPKMTEIYTAVFQTDSNEIVEINVPKDMFDCLEKGQVGELSLVDGELYSFAV